MKIIASIFLVVMSASAVWCQPADSIGSIASDTIRWTSSYPVKRSDGTSAQLQCVFTTYGLERITIATGVRVHDFTIAHADGNPVLKEGEQILLFIDEEKQNFVQVSVLNGVIIFTVDFSAANGTVSTYPIQSYKQESEL